MPIKINGDVKLAENAKTSPENKAKTKRTPSGNGQLNLAKTITTDYEYQQHVHHVMIYDHEWNAIHKKVDKIKEETSNFSIGNAVDGFGVALFIPFFSSLYKIINQKMNVSDDIVNECLLYLLLIAIYIALLIIRKVAKPKWLSTYNEFSSDINTLHDRIDEIENRIGIKKEE